MLIAAIAILFGALMGIGVAATTFSQINTGAVTRRGTQAQFGYALSAIAVPALLSLVFTAGNTSEKLVAMTIAAFESYGALAAVFLLVFAVHSYRKKQPSRE